MFRRVLGLTNAFGAKIAFYLFMKNRLKNIPMVQSALKKLNGKKRYIAAALIAMELASLPAAAQIINKVVFQVRPTVTAVEIPTPEAGLSRFMVVSNAPFTIRSADMIGDINISVHQSGDINGTRFGDNAQMPGPKTNCAALNSPHETVIYQAERKTAIERGTPISQAVIVQIAYHGSAAPSLSFAKDGAAPASVAGACADGMS